MDCSLQLGALASGSAVLRVPSALGCLLVQEGSASGGHLHAVSLVHSESKAVHHERVGLHGSDTLTCDSCLLAPDGPGRSGSISGLLVKQLKPESLERLIRSQQRLQFVAPGSEPSVTSRDKRLVRRNKASRGITSALIGKADGVMLEGYDKSTSPLDQNILYEVHRVAVAPSSFPSRRSSGSFGPSRVEAEASLCLKPPLPPSALQRRRFTSSIGEAALQLSLAQQLDSLPEARLGIGESPPVQRRVRFSAPGLSDTPYTQSNCGGGLMALVKTLASETSSVDCGFTVHDSTEATFPTFPSEGSMAMTLFSNERDGSVSESGCSRSSGVKYADILMPSLASYQGGSGEETSLRDFRLIPRPPGSLSSLVPEPVPPPKDKDLEGVSVRVRAVGLNFRDLLVVSPNLKCIKQYSENITLKPCSICFRCWGCILGLSSTLLEGTALV